MKRNLDLIRHILLVTENSDTLKVPAQEYVNEQFSFEEVSYHITLLVGEDYLIVEETEFFRKGYPDYIVKSLTIKGHDFLDSIRDNNIFNKTKEKLISVGGSTTFDIVKAVALSFLKSQLGI